MTQLAGHQGGFIDGRPGFMLKKLNEKESRCLTLLSKDSLRAFVPAVGGVVDANGAQYLEMKDLLVGFASPAIMDVKIGTRTYSAENDDDDDDVDDDGGDDDDELPRPDLYEKMIGIDPKAPSEKEHNERSITKLRYMDYRDSISSTKSLGFRIEAIKTLGGHSTKDFKTLKDFDAVSAEFRRFCRGGDADLAAGFLKRLRLLRQTLDDSSFFRSHRLVGSSLLFAHDATGNLGVWMIDFCNTDPLPDGVKITHLEPFVPRQQNEDGYLIGVENILRIFEEMLTSN